jgi:hypothetical protein
MAERMLTPGAHPSQNEIADWLGSEAFAFWEKLASFIDETYPGIFIPDWLFSKNLGWSRRYKKSKSFCTFVPEKGEFKLLIVFGGKERLALESVLDTISPEVAELYTQATTYHDGKWLFFVVDSEIRLQDAIRMLKIKRKPRSHV